MKSNHSNSDNLKEQIGDILYKYNDIDGHYDFEPATDELLQLFQDYAMGLVPPEKQTTNAECKWPDHPNNIKCLEVHIPPLKAIELPENIGYNQCRQDILDNLEGKSFLRGNV